MHFKLVRESINIDDDILLDLLLNKIDEGIGDTLYSAISKIGDKKKVLISSINRFNIESNSHNKKRLAKIIVILGLSLYGGVIAHNKLVDSKENKLINIITSETKTSLDKLTHYIKELFKDNVETIQPLSIDVEKFNDAAIYTTSQTAKDLIKQYEKLRLKGYKIKGDGKITIGWGHAEPIKKSKYKVGQIITKKLADELFDKDIKLAENGVKRIFSQWKSNKIEVNITQGMFDAMVSIAYNAGVDGLRSSAFIQSIKRKQFDKAENQIMQLSNSGKFGGLDIRREAEKELYRN